MDKISFRKAIITDVPNLVRLRQQQLLEEGAVPTMDLGPALTDYFKTNISNGSYVSWLGISGGEIIATSGMAFMQKPPYYGNETGYIGLLSSMYTVEGHRRKGIAKHLLGLVIQEAKEYGCKVVQLTASEVGTYLYRDFGFQERPRFMQYQIV